MLRTRTLVSTLSQVLTGGVEGTIVMNRDGMLLAYAGYDDKGAKMVSAIASSIWTQYEKQGRTAFNDEILEYHTMICENGIVMMKRVASVLLCIHAKSDVPLGTLKAKIQTLSNHLEEPLNMVSTT